MRYFYAVLACMAITTAFMIIKIHIGHLLGAVIFTLAFYYTLRWVWRSITARDNFKKDIIQESIPSVNSGNIVSPIKFPSELNSITNSNTYSFDIALGEQFSNENFVRLKQAISNEKTGESFKADIYSDEKYYSVALKEINAKKVSQGLWAMALAYGDGNFEKSKSFYLRERVKKLKELHVEKIKKDLKSHQEHQQQLIRQRHKAQQDANRLKEENKKKDELSKHENEYSIKNEKHCKYKKKLLETSDKEEIASIHVARLRELECNIIGEISPFIVISKQGKKFTIEKLDDLRVAVEDCNTIQLCEFLLSYHGYDLDWNGFKWSVSNAEGHRESFRKADEVMEFCSTI